MVNIFFYTIKAERIDVNSEPKLYPHTPHRVARMSCTTPLKRPKNWRRREGESHSHVVNRSPTLFLLPRAFLPCFVPVVPTFGNKGRGEINLVAPPSSEFFSPASPIAVIEVLKFWKVNYPCSHLSLQAHGNYGLPNPVIKLTNIISLCGL
jgi:hypothetical protein